MATYKVIQNWVRNQYGWLPETCWIAHCKEQMGLPVRQASNRRNNDRRMVPCPLEKREAILCAFRHFQMLD
jgi:hypothetical protein